MVADSSRQGINLQESVKVLTEKSKLLEDDNEKVGTPYYLAPELWRDEPCTKASDVWALGVILYELCCLDYPFPATEEEELKQKVLHQKMEKVKQGISSELVGFINQMLRKDASERPCIEEIIYNDVF